MALKLLIYGIPGTPCLPLCDRLARFHDLNFFSIEIHPYLEDSYWNDKILEIDIDTGDFSTGSDSQHMVRDPSSLRRDNELKYSSVVLADPKDYADCLSEEEMCIVSDLQQGIIYSEIPDTRLIDWASHVLFLEGDESKLANWISKKRNCPTCKAIYHLTDKPPQVINRCDRCGTDLIIDSKDNVKNIKDQFNYWRNGFWKFKELAEKKGIYKTINIDKMRDFNDLLSRVNIWVRSQIENIVNWWDRALEIF